MGKNTYRSLARLLVILVFLIAIPTACNNSDEGNSGHGDSRLNDEVDGSSKASGGLKDEDFENMPDFSGSDTLDFYDQDPGRKDSSFADNYEPGPNDFDSSSAYWEYAAHANRNNQEVQDRAEDNYESDSLDGQREDITKQGPIARDLFNQIGSVNDKNSQKRLYRDIIRKCPDTQEAQLAYYKLANIMMFEENEPDYIGVIHLLKDFHIRYPQSNRLGVVVPLLIRAYEELNRWDKINELYSYLFTNKPDVLKSDIIKHSYRYAQSLEKVNKIDEAVKWYRKTVEKDDGKKNNFIINLAKTRLSELSRKK